MLTCTVHNRSFHRMKVELRTAANSLFGMISTHCSHISTGDGSTRERPVFALPVTSFTGHGQGYLPPEVTRLRPAFPPLSPSLKPLRTRDDFFFYRFLDPFRQFVQMRQTGNNTVLHFSSDKTIVGS